MKTCANGHPQDSSWAECPYCKREREAKSRSQAPEPPSKENQSMADRNARNPTRVEQPAARRETKYQPPAGQPASAVKPDPQDNRRIVGVLASYTWRVEGELFPVREGRTHIGAGSIKQDTQHRQVEVYCPSDPLLSEDHAEILRQAGRFYIRDLSSTNGTFLNGSADPIIPETAVELTHNAEIRAGKTVFTFLKIEPRSATKTEKVRDELDELQKVPDEIKPPRRSDTR